VCPLRRHLHHHIHWHITPPVSNISSLQVAPLAHDAFGHFQCEVHLSPRGALVVAYLLRDVSHQFCVVPSISENPPSCMDSCAHLPRRVQKVLRSLCVG
jgi:hypothetical protein